MSKSFQAILFLLAGCAARIQLSDRGNSADGRVVASRRDEIHVSARAAAADHQSAAGRSRPRAVLRSGDLGVGQDRLRHLPSAAARLGGHRPEEPERFRQAHLAPLAAADRHGTHRQVAGRLGRPQPDTRGAGEVVDRDRLDVDERDADAGEGRGDRGAHPRERRLCGEVQGGARRRADQHRHHRAGDRGVRAHARARRRAVRPLDRGRRERDLGRPPSAASSSTTARRCASPAIAAGASPTTCSTTSAPPPPIAAAAPW